MAKIKGQGSRVEGLGIQYLNLGLRGQSSEIRDVRPGVEGVQVGGKHCGHAHGP